MKKVIELEVTTTGKCKDCPSLMKDEWDSFACPLRYDAVEKEGLDRWKPFKRCREAKTKKEKKD